MISLDKDETFIPKEEQCNNNFKKASNFVVVTYLQTPKCLYFKYE